MGKSPFDCYKYRMPGKSLAKQQAEQAARDEGRDVRGAYHPGFDRRAADYCLLGATNTELGQLLGVAEKTIEQWLVERPSFARAVRRGRVEADARVARSMFAAAMGTKVKERRTRRDKSGAVVETIEVIKEHPPNVAAATLILTNRAGQHWKDKRASEVSVGLNLAALIEGLHGAGTKIIEGQATTLPVATEPGDKGK